MKKMNINFNACSIANTLIESTMYFLLCVHPKGSFYQKIHNRDNPKFHCFVGDLFTKYHELQHTNKLNAKNIQ